MKKVLSLVLVLALVIMPMLTFAAVPISNVEADYGDITGLDGTVNKAVGIVTYVGYAIAVVMVLWLGVQWLLATPAKKAELKGKMWSMAIGILLLVGGVTILGIVWDASIQATTSLAK